MAINKEWHFKNKMPKNPTHDQRMKWHQAHNKICQCYPLSDKLKGELKEWENKNK
jgi:hypothetical protein